ncbi:hypothetical protein IDSA_07785 [Pseudidiomarina salinarum]|uniref:Orphan protein n=1 Tax=Pseudidiomarina salinarum TaxID=435908 RepID=A0A094JEG9_9GAMM|nr:DUF6702 family protein [Pseudidiomarina salinarum]KFZ30961.1 hypothetical protein IDSA_07785 [Pseudidiomarina salinarum]RUO71449.1 hypothetical protein CWI79_08475 [Pseudidiomarina salinarum]
MRYIALALFGLMLMGQATAHQLKTAITTVLFNDRTGNIEVMHKFLLHDAEHAVQQLFDKAGNMHTRDATRKQFSDYVLTRFKMTDLDGQPLPLELVGYQVDGADFWIYQEAPIPAELEGLQMQHKALQDIWSSQQNLVNVEGRGAIQSLKFSAADDWQRVRFAQ